MNEQRNEPGEVLSRFACYLDSLLPNASNEFAREAKKHIEVVHCFVINEAEAAVDLILLLSIFRGGGGDLVVGCQAISHTFFLYSSLWDMVGSHCSV